MTREQLQEYIKCAKDPVYFLNTYGKILNIAKQPVTLRELSCFDYQVDILKKFQKYQNNIVLKSRQCLPENTFLDTPDGPKAIQNINKGDIVYSYNFDRNKYQQDIVQDKWDCGPINCVKIKLKDSRSLEIGENHPLYVKNKKKWVPAKDLERGDEIEESIFSFGEIEANSNEIKMLAYLLTDGSTISQVKFTNNNVKYLDEFESSVNNVFPNLKISKRAKQNGFDYFPHQPHGTNTINPIMEWCQEKNIAGKKTEFKLIPTEVFYWNKKSISLFINRLFAGDGWISILKKTSNQRLELGIASPSKEFLEQIKFLLKKYNINCNIYEVFNMRLQKNKFFKLRISHSKSIKKFIDEIGIYDKILPEHIEIINSIKHNVISAPKVQSVKNVGTKLCYDISVTLNENYFINGLLTHNTGMSVIAAGFVVWTLLFKIDQKVLIVANDRNGAVRFLTTVKQYLEYIPSYLLPSNREKDNETEIVFSNNNTVKAVAAGKNAGRGETPSLLILDETAFIENAESIWAAASLALSGTKGKCIMISTPYGKGNLYHTTWVNAVEGKNDFIPTTIHWTEHPVYSKGIEEKIDEYGRRYKTSPWYEYQCEQLNHDKVKIAQELDLSFEGSRALVIDKHIIDKHREKIKATERPPHYYNFREEGSGFINTKTDFWVWKLPELGANYIVSCLPKGEKVLTTDGLKNIEEIVISDTLVDLNGFPTNIKNIQITPDYTGDIFEYKMSNIYRKTSFTNNHPIWASSNTVLKRNYNKKHESLKFNERYWDFNFDFVKAENLSIGDWVEFPNMYKQKELSKEEIIKKWETYAIANRVDFTIDCPLLDKDFWWYVGIWLAEGWYYRGKNYQNVIYTVHNIKTEQHYAEKIKTLWEKYNRTVSLTNKDSVIQTQFSSTQIVDFFEKNFSKYASNKKISEWIKFLPEEFKLQILKGYLDGDGCQFVSRNELKTTYVSISLSLLEDIQDIFFSCGILPVVKKLRDANIHTFPKNRMYNTKVTYELNLGHYDSIKFLNKLEIPHNYTFKNRRIIKDSFFSKDESKIYFKITEKNKYKYSGPVYNFETESHTFLCKNIATHNCDVGRGDGADYSTIQVIKADGDLEQVAEYQGKIAPDLFASIIYKVAMEYNKGYVVVECNSFGLATSLTLKNQLKYDPRRIHHSKSVKKLVNHHFGVQADEESEIPGFQTTQQSRVLIIAALTAYLRDSKIILNSIRLINEFEHFIYNGVKAEHEKGKHDDLIIALGIGLLIRDKEFENVFLSKEFYKNMIASISYSTSGKPTDNGKVIEDEFKAKTQEQYKIPDITKSTTTNDDDLRWLLGNINRD